MSSTDDRDDVLRGDAPREAVGTDRSDDHDDWDRLVAQVEAWVADDPDPVTADELSALYSDAQMEVR